MGLSGLESADLIKAKSVAQSRFRIVCDHLEWSLPGCSRIVPAPIEVHKRFILEMVLYVVNRDR
jgi:hypothetical protein